MPVDHPGGSCASGWAGHGLQDCADRRRLGGVETGPATHLLQVCEELKRNIKGYGDQKCTHTGGLARCLRSLSSTCPGSVRNPRPGAEALVQGSDRRARISQTPGSPGRVRVADLSNIHAPYPKPNSGCPVHTRRLSRSKAGRLCPHGKRGKVRARTQTRHPRWDLACLGIPTQGLQVSQG